MSDNRLATVTQWLDESRPSFEEMNLNKLDFNKEKEFMIQAFQNNPYLLGMEPNSVRNILVNCALTGITLNPVMKFGYPVPRKGKLCLDVSYVGMIKILTDTGSVKSIKAGTLYSNELFDIELGSGGYVKHKPYFGANGKGHRIGCYSLATLNDGSIHVHWMYEEDIQGIMKRSEAYKSGKQNPWLSDYDQMAQKTVIKQHFKYLPKSARAEMAANVIDIDHETNGIDFKAEQQKAEAEQRQGTVNLDGFMSPSNPEHCKIMDELVALFDNPSLPTKLNEGQLDVQGNKNGMIEMFNTLKLTEKSVEQWKTYLTQEINKHSQQTNEEGELG